MQKWVKTTKNDQSGRWISPIRAFFLLFSVSLFSVLRPETNSSKNQSDINNACFVTKCQDDDED